MTRWFQKRRDHGTHSLSQLESETWLDELPSPSLGIAVNRLDWKGREETAHVVDELWMGHIPKDHGYSHLQILNFKFQSQTLNYMCHSIVPVQHLTHYIDFGLKPTFIKIGSKCCTQLHNILKIPLSTLSATYQNAYQRGIFVIVIAKLSKLQQCFHAFFAQCLHFYLLLVSCFPK